MLYSHTVSTYARNSANKHVSLNIYCYFLNKFAWIVKMAQTLTG